MIDYEQFQFAAPPGTEARNIVRVFNACGLSNLYPSRTVYIPFRYPSEKPKLSVVCHPYTWLCRIHYLLSKTPGLGRHLGIHYPALCRNMNLESFLEQCGQMKGAVGRFFDRYQADVVFRWEDLPWALEEYLESLGIEDNIIREALKMIPTTKAVLPIASAKRKIIQIEAEYCDRYEYY